VHTSTDASCTQLVGDPKLLPAASGPCYKCSLLTTMTMCSSQTLDVPAVRWTHLLPGTPLMPPRSIPHSPDLRLISSVLRQALDRARHRNRLANGRNIIMGDSQPPMTESGMYCTVDASFSLPVQQAPDCSRVHGDQHGHAVV
jgi:hypothetical protein